MISNDSHQSIAMEERPINIDVDGEKIQNAYYKLKACGGVHTCSNQALDSTTLVEKIIAKIEDIGYFDFMKKRTPKYRPDMIDQRFSISVSSCPNACSHPQIQDFGIIGRTFIERALGEGPQYVCTKCGKCVQACQEQIIELFCGEPEIDYTKCIGCGDCFRACETEALGIARRGYTVLIGGRLSRHLQPGQDVLMLANEDEVVSALSVSLKFFMEESAEDEIFSDFVSRIGIDIFRAKIGEGVRKTEARIIEKKRAKRNAK